ncbi:regulator of G-protein signaling 9a [Morone saxatilis]|uniref:regulator of G-protein signaling 9a n=1 Tax=Morone saxatilis TaxID=34816 RepID=UPI0015E1E6B8|nr:regulator of G-protein signaling 9a [Morone saxatilis]
MTIRTVRPDRGQHFRPGMHCLKKLEAILVEMQDSKSGVKGSEQKLNVTTIPHVIADHTESLILLQSKPFQTPYFWPTQKWVAEDTDYAIYLAKRNIRKKGMLEPYEQAHYNHLHEWLNHKWDFIVMQATEQYKAGKERKKPDRVVFDCQERAYWIVNRPPRRTHSAMDSGPDCLFDPTADEKISFDQYRRRNLFYQQAIMRSKVKSSVSLGALVKYITTYKNHDPFLAPCLPSNPWQTDNDTYWTLNMRRVEVPTKMRVERWSFSLFELLSDLRGRDDFKIFLKKEFSGENLAFWEAAEELKWGTSSSMSAKAETIFNYPAAGLLCEPLVMVKGLSQTGLQQLLQDRVERADLDRKTDFGCDAAPRLCFFLDLQILPLRSSSFRPAHLACTGLTSAAALAFPSFLLCLGVPFATASDPPCFPRMQCFRLGQSSPMDWHSLAIKRTELRDLFKTVLTCFLGRKIVLEAASLVLLPPLGYADPPCITQQIPRRLRPQEGGHIYFILCSAARAGDTFFRYLKSPVYKDTQKKALNPEPHNFSPAQLEQNARNLSPGIHPIILWQQEEEEKAKAATASAPVDVKAMMSKIDRKK